MNWFFRWLHKRVEKSIVEEQIKVTGVLKADSIDDTGGVKSINFSMLFADGGVVLQQRHYDPIKDRSHNKLYLIPEDQDVAQRVGEIVAMEMYRV